jgi:ubiquinone/menaquinone biosynthesis C-methylase UbiE
MKSLQNNYDPVAAYYDLLSKLIFGRAEMDAQVRFLDRLSVGDQVLVVGGGTGWILEEMAAIRPEGLGITYVESSRKMMSKAKRRPVGKNKVSYVLAPVEEFQTRERYDYILTGFFFDNFSTEHCRIIIQKLDCFLKTKGFWCNADFYCSKETSPIWQQVLLRSMYISARIICNVQARRLPDTEPVFRAAGYEQLFTRQFYHGMIRSILYQKNDRQTV